MRIKVTYANIIAYRLDTITGNTVTDLLLRAKQEQEKGNELFVRIPDVMGGDTEAPGERNVFEHYSEVPDPEGFMHKQNSIDLTDVCSYKLGIDRMGRGVFVCTTHGAVSKYSVDAESHAACVVVDPYDD